MYQPTIILNKKIFVFKFLFFFLLISCKNEHQNQRKNATVASADSIQIWIKKSKRKGLALKTRRLFLQKALQKAEKFPNNSLKSRYYASLSYLVSKTNDSTAFRAVNTAGRKLAKKINDSTGLAEMHWDLATFFKQSVVQDSSYYHYGEAEKIFDALGNDYSSGRMLYNMALVQSKVKDYTGSEISTIKAIEKFKPLNKHKNLYRCYNLLGIVTSSLKEYERGLEYYDEALVYLRMSGANDLIELGVKNNIGMVYKEQGQHRKAVAYATEVLKYDSLGFKNPALYAKALANLGYNTLKLGKTDKLPGLFNRALYIQDSIGDLIGQSLTAYNLAEYLLAEKDTVGALYNLQKSKKLAQQSSNNERLLNTLRMFPKVDPKNATHYTQEYITLSDDLHNQERKIREKFARIRFETDEFIAENQHLVRQKQLWTGIAAALVLLGITTFLIFDQRTKNKVLKFKQKQQASNQKIFNLMMAQTDKVAQGKKIAQKRISEELHDGVLGRMLGARLRLIGLNKKADTEAISERAKAIAELQDVEREVRAISHELSHAAYQKIHTFILSIENLLKTIETSSKISIDFTHTDSLDWDKLSGDIKINLYRMVQESLQNAVKHAACKNISLYFHADNEHLKITIVDDGKGFSTKKGKKGIGMRNIASRIKKLNGTWNIDSEIGKGTQLTFVIPTVYNERAIDVTSIEIEEKNLQEI
ncbi:diguanylate cyclase/phosphodiesterase (GGDEF & EAL domains) with PAS/PAC sensor(s) [hydrothermal vent metagenome]|uniref:histidine kinase n=1 Tax=hydrothermal vent metagenome TaxID=652676 RepID=A0A3B0TI75_9ZZZZ